MNLVKTLQILSNDVRLNILEWLGNPAEHFRQYGYELENNALDEEQSVCVGLIQKKCNLSQSTVSQYMALMESVNLVIAKRKSKWTYYRRNETTLQQFTHLLKHKLKIH